jgi:hypothetical protein
MKGELVGYWGDVWSGYSPLNGTLNIKKCKKNTQLGRLLQGR